MKEESIVKEALEKYPEIFEKLNGHRGMFGMCDINYYDRQAYIAGRSAGIESEKAKDERIKELHTALKDLYVSIVDKEYYRFHSSCLIRVKQLLNK